MKPYRSVFKEAGEYNDPHTRQFISNIINMGFNAKSFALLIDRAIYIEYNLSSNPEYSQSGYMPDSNNLNDLSNYLLKNQLSKINKNLLSKAWREVRSIEGFYQDNDLDLDADETIREDIFALETAFEGIF